MNIRKLKSRIIFYVFVALAATGIGLFLRTLITHFLGLDLAAYIIFYPFILLVAVMGGLEPSLLATVTSALIVDYWLLPPYGSFELNNPTDAVEITLFIIMGVSISVVVGLYHRKQLQTQELLRENVKKFKRLYDSNIIGVLFWDITGNICQANDEFLRIVGYTEDDVLSGRVRWKEMTPPEYAPLDEKAIKEMMATGVSAPFEKEYIRKDGQRVPVLLRTAMLEGQKNAGICFVQELSGQKNMIQKLKDSYAGLEEKVLERTQDLENAKLAADNVLEDLSIEKAKVEMAEAKEEAILLSIGDGLLVTDEKGNITIINQAAEKMLGRNNEEVLGKLLATEIPLEDKEGVSIPFNKRPINLALEVGTISSSSTSSSYFYVRKDKTRFPVAIMVTPVIFEGKVIGAIDVFRDITQEKAIDKAKTEFVSLASHQLRTPLTTVSWYTETILKGDVGKVVPSQKKYLQEIYRGNQRMIELVNTLLDVSRLELGTVKIEPRTVDILELAQSVLDEQRQNIDKKKIQCHQTFSRGIPIFLVDPKLLRMIFQNLLSNAVKYAPPGGKIEFAISFGDPPSSASRRTSDRQDKERIKSLSQRIPPCFYIKVSDTGCGIPKNQQDKIFSKLFRADNVREKDTDGTGLGLYIVKSIVNQLKGEVWFESVENKGTTFHVLLPSHGTTKKNSPTST